MKIFNDTFLQDNKKKLTVYIVTCFCIFLLMMGLLIMFAFLTNISNYILFLILSCLVSVLGGSSILFIILEYIRQIIKNLYFYGYVNASKPLIIKGRIVGAGKKITLQKSIKATEYELLTEGKRIVVCFNNEINDCSFSIDEKGIFTIMSNFIVGYEKEK